MALLTSIQGEMRVIVTLFLACVVFLVGCRRTEQPIVVHVAYDPALPSARQLGELLYRYNSGSPKEDGRPVLVAWLATKDRAQFFEKLGLVREGMALIIVASETNLRSRSGFEHLESPIGVCGDASAYLTEWVPPEEQGPARRYLDFVVANCKTE